MSMKYGDDGFEILDALEFDIWIKNQIKHLKKTKKESKKRLYSIFTKEKTPPTTIGVKRKRVTVETLHFFPIKNKFN